MKLVSILAIAVLLLAGGLYVATSAQPSASDGAAFATLGNVGVLLDQTFGGDAVSPAIPIASGSYNGMNNFKVEFAPVAGNVSACTVYVDSSVDGRTWTQGGAISAQTCTAEGAAAGGPVAAKFVRLDLTVTGGRVRVRLLGGMSTAGLYLPLAGGTMTGPIHGNVDYSDDAFGSVTGGLSFTDSHGNVLGIGQVGANNFIDLETATSKTAILGDDLNGIQFYVYGSVLPGSLSISQTRGIVLTPPSIGVNNSRLPVTIDLSALQPFANNAAALAAGLLPGALYRSGSDPDVVAIVH